MSKKRGQPIGFRWIWAVRDRGPKEWNATVRAVLYTLGTYLDNEKGTTIVSQEKLSDGANVHRHTVRTVLKRVEKDGWLRCWKQKGEGQRWAMTGYQVIIPPEKVVQSDYTTSEERLSHPGPKVVQNLPEGCIARPYTNSMDSNNSGRLEPVGLDGTTGSAPVEDIPQTALGAYESLTQEDREYIAQEIGGGFPPERVTVRTYWNLTPDQKRELQERQKAREAA